MRSIYTISSSLHQDILQRLELTAFQATEVSTSAYISLQNTWVSPYFHYNILYVITHWLEMELSLVWVEIKVALNATNFSFNYVSFQRFFQIHVWYISICETDNLWSVKQCHISHKINNKELNKTRKSRYRL